VAWNDSGCFEDVEELWRYERIRERVFNVDEVQSSMRCEMSWIAQRKGRTNVHGSGVFIERITVGVLEEAWNEEIT